jgi:hypothetical protein
MLRKQSTQNPRNPQEVKANTEPEKLLTCSRWRSSSFSAPFEAAETAARRTVDAAMLLAFADTLRK